MGAPRDIRAGRGDSHRWRAYLDRQHSAVSQALAVCAAECRTKCSVITRHDAATRQRLDRACTAAAEFTASAIVRLRHSAPVGHGFGVPSMAEVAAAWERSRDVLARREPAVRLDDGFPLPGLPSLFSAVAGTRIVADTLVGDTVAALCEALAED